MYQLRCWNVLRWHWSRCGDRSLPSRCVFHVRCDICHLHAVSCWPISRPHGPVRVHTLQPRFISKRIRTGTLPLLLTRHVLRNVCVDSGDWPVPSRFLLCSRSNFCHLHAVSCWPVSRPHGPARVHTLQPRFISKRIRTGTVPLLLTRHVLRNVCVDSGDWPVPSRCLLCSRSNFCHLHSVRPRFISANNGPARVHTLQPRSLLHWLGPDCRDRQLPSGFIFNWVCCFRCLHAMSSRIF
jgi:hypothetical protein